MSGPGPSTQANAAARKLRAAEDKKRREAEDSEVGDSEDEDDSELDKDGNEKQPVYHWQIWRKLLREGSMRRKGSRDGLLRYVNRAPQHGSHPLDITAVYEPQIHWDMENRSFWPADLKLWAKEDRLNTPTYDVGIMRYKGHVVLDCAGKPINNFRIPLTISSEVEGLRVESWMRADKRLRLDDSLRLEDIVARMWTKDGPAGKVPAFGTRTLSKRASLARTRAGLISWAIRAGRDAQTAFMDSLRTPQQRASGLATDQNLTPQQMGTYATMGLDENRQSNAPTRAERIKKIKRAAARGDTVTGTGTGSGGATAGPTDQDAAASSEDDDPMDVDSEDEADPETQAQEETSADVPDDQSSASSSLIDPFDSRHDQPANPEEEALLGRALEITVADFFSLTGQQPGPTDPGDNYFSQWGQLQAQLITLWKASRNTDEALPVPRLRARDRWTGGISQFEFAEETEAGWYPESESE